MPLSFGLHGSRAKESSIHGTLYLKSFLTRAGLKICLNVHCRIIKNVGQFIVMADTLPLTVSGFGSNLIRVFPSTTNDGSYTLSVAFVGWPNHESDILIGDKWIAVYGNGTGNLALGVALLSEISPLTAQTNTFFGHNPDSVIFHFLKLNAPVNNADQHVLAVVQDTSSVIPEDVTFLHTANLSLNGNYSLLCRKVPTPSGLDTVRIGTKNFLVAQYKNSWHLVVK